MGHYVLITGSRSITHSESIPLLIDSLIKRGVEIVVGDAPGVDRLVIEEALSRGYGKHVTVVGAYGECRNTSAIGKVSRVISLNSTYLARNLYMVGLSRECFAIWDGVSRGTKFTFEAAKRAGLKVSVIYEPQGRGLASYSQSHEPQGQGKGVMPYREMRNDDFNQLTLSI